jgi:hypothetical protein
MPADCLRHIPCALTAAFCLSISACNSGTVVVKQPSIDASAAGKQAMEMYDKNGDKLQLSKRPCGR